MKLNLGADYNVCGKRCCSAFAIDSCNNLMGLPKLTTLAFPAADGGFVYIAPTFLLMCESRRKAEEVAADWERTYKEDGRLYDYKPIDRYAHMKEGEVVK